jgi:SAM-dependent methyltransferase
MPPCMVTRTDPGLSLHDYLGRRILERLTVRRGMRVLEVCHPSHVIPIPPLDGAEWHVADICAIPHDTVGFDVVLCGFGIHHARDMTATSRRLWQLVRPAGQLLIATWSQQLFEPADAAFWETVRHVEPSLGTPFNPWDAIDTPERLVDMLAAAGIPGGQVAEEPYLHPLKEAEEWWEIVMHSHYRAIVEQLAPFAREAVELLTVRHLTEREIDWINAGALFALARK